MLSKYDVFISCEPYEFLLTFDILRSPFSDVSFFVDSLFSTVDWFFEKKVYIPNHFYFPIRLSYLDLPF